MTLQVGFTIHHAKHDYIMMTAWIHDSEPNHLPHYAGHYIGVGGFVVNEHDELLVVQERFSRLGVKHWKLPGGQADPGNVFYKLYKWVVHLHMYIFHCIQEYAIVCFRRCCMTGHYQYQNPITHTSRSRQWVAGGSSLYISPLQCNFSLYNASYKAPPILLDGRSSSIFIVHYTIYCLALMLIYLPSCYCTLCFY